MEISNETNRNSLLKHLVILMFFMFVANFVILKFYWYSLIWYSDIIMHLLGGFWLGLFFTYIFSIKKLISSVSSLFFKVIFATLVIGLLWEFYQFFLNTVSLVPFDFIDTILDVFFDLLGSIIAVLYFLKFIMSTSVNKVQLKNEQSS